MPQDDGPHYYIALKFPLYDIKEKPYAVCGIATDITERKLAEEKIKQDYQIQSTISSILRISLEPISLEEQLDRILGMILSIPWLALHSKGCIYLVEDDPQVLVMKVQREFAESQLTTCARVPFGKCLCGRAASARRLLFADRVDDRHELCYQDMLPHGHYCIPILPGDRLLGIINLYVKEGHKRNRVEEDFLSTVADTLAGIVERKQAEEELSSSHEKLRNLSTHLQYVREEERAHIAHEIHDDLGQLLTALKMELSLLKKGLSKDQKSLLEKANLTLNLVHNTIQTVQRISSELRPDVLDQLGLTSAIEWQLGEFQNRFGIRCELIMDPEEIILDKDISTTVFRILQEALTNIARHAEATRVKVRLIMENGNLMFKVEDNGKGITDEQISDYRSFGLIGMRERVHAYDGVTTISGIQGKGTTVMVSIPLKKG